MSRAILAILLFTGCTTYRTPEDIVKNRGGEPVQYATESHWWMVPRDTVITIKKPDPPIQQDGYTQVPNLERQPPCTGISNDSEPHTCR